MQVVSHASIFGLDSFCFYIIAVNAVCSPYCYFMVHLMKLELSDGSLHTAKMPPIVLFSILINFILNLVLLITQRQLPHHSARWFSGLLCQLVPLASMALLSFSRYKCKQPSINLSYKQSSLQCPKGPCIFC